MKLNIFKRTKVENSIDLEGMMIELPKSKKEMLLTDIVTKFDAIQNMNGYANGDHMVKVGEDEMSVNDLVKKHIDMQNKMSSMENDEEGEGEPGMDEEMENDEDEEGTVDAGLADVDSRGGDESLENEEDEELEAEPKKKKMNSASIKLANAKKIAANKAKAKALANAHTRDVEEETATVELSCDQVARGKARYGS